MQRRDDEGVEPAAIAALLPLDGKHMVRHACPVRRDATTGGCYVTRVSGAGGPATAAGGARRNCACVVRSAGIAASFAAPALAPFLERDRGDGKRGERVGPPPACERIRTKAEQERDREVGAELRLCRFLDRGGGVELIAEPPLRVGEQRHRRRRDRGQADPD